jgi:hypothetical protein
MNEQPQGVLRRQVRAWRSLRRYDAVMADLNRMAYRIVKESTEPRVPETPAHVNGRNGGLKGGKARATKLTPEERSEIARKAAQARWQNTTAP